MLFLSKDDFYEVYLKSLISDVDRETLTMLYQPIIGADAVSLYLTLYADFKKSKSTNSIQSHEDLCVLMGHNITEIYESRRKLEAIGLIRTYYKEEKNVSFYKYLLFAPKTPKDFFDDILFKGLLIEKIGEKRVQSLMRKYKEKELSLDGFNEISDKFTNVFNPNLDSNSFKNDTSIDGYNRKSIDVSKGFDMSLFLKTLENSYGILKDIFSSKALNKLSQIALLYGINEITFADIFSRSYMDKKSINFDTIIDLAIKEKDYNFIRNDRFASNIAYDTESKLGKKIEIMSSIAPYDYLKLKQNTSMVSDADRRLIDDLSTMYGLNYSVINCLLDYCIERTGKLSKSYVTKIAASLKRENIESTLDCMNYLKNSNKSKDKRIYQKKEDTETKKENNEEISDSDLDELLSGL